VVCVNAVETSSAFCSKRASNCPLLFIV
jgi:hypothetical protein